MTDQLTISPRRPTDISMDYELLRAEGIRHLEQLASHIWTDFNAHDPGITILEVLCYAITDLGYRANLPIADLLANGGAKDSAFFRPAEMLPNQPYTAQDYRKLFIDVDGVKNAWVHKFYSKSIVGAPEHLNGLYHLLVELNDGSLSDGKTARAIEKRLRDCYHANRNLGEDIARVSIVQDCPFCLCLDLELDPTANPKEVVAEAAFNLQNWLAPFPRFHSFRELRNQGVACEDILDGPLLENGFLPDEELENSPLRQKIYKSDLIRLLVETEGVLAVNNFAWKKVGDQAKFHTGWCMDFTECAVGEAAGDCENFYQPYFDLCCSKIWVTRGVMREEIKEGDYREALDLLELARGIPVDRSLPLAESGRYRPDLADYPSVQFEFPENYAIGDNELSVEATAERRAQVKQLRAFLTFFDQILAAYLQQLAGVRDLLSVNQDPGAVTVAGAVLHDVPGMADLVADFKVFALSAARIAEWGIDEESSADLDEKLDGIPADFPRRFTSASIFKQRMSTYLGRSIWSLFGAELSSFFEVESTESDWNDFCNSEEGSYFQSVDNLVETQPQRELRRNRIMDHLLSRFGESFTHYSLQFFSTRVDRENDPESVLFSDYLADKAAFLRDLPTLTRERGSGFNYRAKDRVTGALNVWNTDNVAGLKKRVSRLLGMDDYSARSLECDPDYDLRIKRGEAKNGMPNYRLELLIRKDQRVLLTSKTYSSRSKKKIIEHQEQARKELDNEDYYLIAEKDGLYKVVFEFPGDIKAAKKSTKKASAKTDPIRLESASFRSRQLAENWLSNILTIIRGNECDREGFHLLEHILLRPNDGSDQLIQLKSGSCAADFADQYSFIVSVILPNWPPRFRDENFKRYVEQIFRREAPAHLYLRFCWLGQDDLQQFERPYQRWREALANCTPDECEVNTWANRLIELLNKLDCSCDDPDETPFDPCGLTEVDDKAGS